MWLPGLRGYARAQGRGDTLVAGGSSEPAALPVSQAPTYAINGVVNEYHYQWGSYTPGTATTVTYSFLTSVPGYYAANAGERNQFAAMNATQKQVTRDTFALFAEAANITFVEVAPGTASINLATANLGAGIGGWAYYPYPGYSGPGDQTVMGDVWITNRYASYSNPTKGSWEYLTIIHEIGHAIGLKHPGNYNAGGGGTGGPYLPTSEDSHQYTVMSYYSGPSYGSTEPSLRSSMTSLRFSISTASTARRARATTPMRSRRRCRSRPSGTAGEPTRSTCRTRRKPSSSICVPDASARLPAATTSPSRSAHGSKTPSAAHLPTPSPATMPAGRWTAGPATTR